MDQDIYTQHFTNHERWILKAKQHCFVVETLTDPTALVDKKFVQKSSIGSNDITQHAQQVMALSNARALHMGLAIENAVKARQIFTGTITVDNGKVKGLRKDHNILEHVKQLGISLNEEEQLFLERMSYQAITGAKYPIAKDLKTQDTFTGIIIGNKPEELDMTKQIILKILKEQELIDLFDNDH